MTGKGATAGRLPAVALALGISACTTITAPKAPKPGLQPVIFQLDKERALSGVRSAFEKFPDVEDLRRTDHGIEFHYRGFAGAVTLICLSGKSEGERSTGWWPAVALEGRSTWLWPWATARVLTFYGSMPEVARRGLRRAGAQRLRVANAEIADPGECEG